MKHSVQTRTRNIKLVTDSTYDLNHARCSKAVKTETSLLSTRQNNLNNDSSEAQPGCSYKYKLNVDAEGEAVMVMETGINCDSKVTTK